MGVSLTVDEFVFHDRKSTLWGWPEQSPSRHRDPSGREAEEYGWHPPAECTNFGNSSIPCRIALCHQGYGRYLRGDRKCGKSVLHRSRNRHWAYRVESRNQLRNAQCPKERVYEVRPEFMPRARPMRVALCLGIILVASPIVDGCAGTAGSNDGRAYQPGETEPEWLTKAVVASREAMEVRCADFAPLEILMTSAPLYAACVGDASVAAIASRERVYREALGRCVAEHHRPGPVSCCFTEVTDQRDIMLQEHSRCDRDCAAQVGAEAAKFPDRNRCNPVNVSPSRVDRNRADTTAVREVLARCDADPDASTLCDQLPSWVGREYCRNTCQVRRQEFGVALHMCVNLTETEGRSIGCAIRADRQEACAAACREMIRRRQNHGVESDTAVETGETPP